MPFWFFTLNVAKGLVSPSLSVVFPCCVVPTIVVLLLVIIILMSRGECFSGYTCLIMAALFRYFHDHRPHFESQLGRKGKKIPPLGCKNEFTRVPIHAGMNLGSLSFSASGNVNDRASTLIIYAGL